MKCDKYHANVNLGFLIEIPSQIIVDDPKLVSNTRESKSEKSKRNPEKNKSYRVDKSHSILVDFFFEN
jgi:hypothetical protein